MLSRSSVPISIAFLIAFTFLVSIPAPAPVRAGDSEDGLLRHRQRLGVADWYRAGYLGRGVKVAVVDGDFSGYKDQLGETLPQLRSRPGRFETTAAWRQRKAATDCGRLKWSTPSRLGRNCC